MAKGREVLKALERNGWRIERTQGSHHVLRRGERTAIFAFHPNRELGKADLAKVSQQFGVPVEELRK